MSRVRVKICGITREEDLDAAVNEGADAIGFVMWPNSARAIDVERLVTLSARVPPFVTRVGLFVDQDAELIARCAPWLDLLQFHGDEPPEACEGYGKAWIKAVRMRDDVDLAAIEQRYSAAQGLLLDAFRPGIPGGTGETFDWSRIPRTLAKPVILAGGLTPDNIAAAITAVHPWGVDVSGGVELERGIKDPVRLQAFIRNVSNRGVTGEPIQ
ncbi:phosphoribosylanthranilate isomerase [Kushneria phosphatilytica]|nr:phosphoribosylanthranilate isomerase [Kushneria phosphatilytica]